MNNHKVKATAIWLHRGRCAIPSSRDSSKNPTNGRGWLLQGKCLQIVTSNQLRFGGPFGSCCEVNDWRVLVQKLASKRTPKTSLPKLSWLKILASTWSHPVTQSSWTSANTSRFHGATVGGLGVISHWTRCWFAYPAVDDWFQFPYAKKWWCQRSATQNQWSKSARSSQRKCWDGCFGKTSCQNFVESTFEAEAFQMFEAPSYYSPSSKLPGLSLISPPPWIQVKNSKSPGK